MVFSSFKEQSKRLNRLLIAGGIIIMGTTQRWQTPFTHFFILSLTLFTDVVLFFFCLFGWVWISFFFFPISDFSAVRVTSIYLSSHPSLGRVMFVVLQRFDDKSLPFVALLLQKADLCHFCLYVFLLHYLLPTHQTSLSLLAALSGACFWKALAEGFSLSLTQVDLRGWWMADSRYFL